MSNDIQLKLTRVHAIKYKMPLKRPYGTARGVTRASSNMVIQVHGLIGDLNLLGTGEAQARRRLTGDISVDASWDFFNIASQALVNKVLSFSDTSSALGEVRQIMSELQTLAVEQSDERNESRPFRGSLLGIEVALLDTVARALGTSVTEVLGGEVRTEVPITVRTLSTQSAKGRINKKVAQHGPIFPMIRIKGKGSISEDLDLLEAIAKANAEAGYDSKPIWMDLNEGLQPGEANLFVERIAELISQDRLPKLVTLEQPVHERYRSELPALQKFADESVALLGDSAEIRIMPDESIWDIDDLQALHHLGGCRAINIKTAKAGGLIASLDLAKKAVELNPEIRICIGGMVGTSDISTWAILSLAKALPRLDYITAAPPANVAERISEPLTQLRENSNIHEQGTDEGIGANLAYDKLLPYIEEQRWYPAPVDKSTSENKVNSYGVEHLRPFNKIQLDNHLLEREALRLGLSTLRVDPLAFVASDSNDESIAFQWTRSSASLRAAVGITSDKQTTRLLLQRAGVPVPDGHRFKYDDREQSQAFLASMNGPVVLKPLRGTGGKGVVTGIRTADELEWAFDALKGTPYEGRDVVVEEEIQGASGRLFVVGDQVLSMIFWPHGEITGDGEQTVAELLSRKQDMRMQNPHLMNRPLKFDSGMQRLMERANIGYDSILKHGEKFKYTLNPNPQQGGETYDAISELHPSFIEASIRAVRAIPGLAYAGVDWIIPDHTKPLDTQRAAICEINAHPSHSGNEFPLYGTPSKISHEIVKCVAINNGLLTKTDYYLDNISVKVTVSGNVTSGAYISWFAEQAEGLGLSGKLEKSGERIVVAHLSGETDLVASLVSRAISGPPGATIEKVKTVIVDGTYNGKFETVA